ncbi:MAG: hypothetical protein Q8K40_01645, partial [Ignavibacteria bacterium]|nr:hypothetical protein [Ignavibacteria bacterium]
KNERFFLKVSVTFSENAVLSCKFASAGGDGFLMQEVFMDYKSFVNGCRLQIRISRVNLA